MGNVPVIGGVSDVTRLRQKLYQSGTEVHAPYGAGLLPLTGGTLTGTLTATNVTFTNANDSANTATLDGYTDWIAYTPTFTGFGTVASVSFWSKRTGDTLYIRGKFTVGTPTATEARITLGFNGTNANVNSDATKVPSLMLAGDVGTTLVSANAFYVLIESNIGYLTFGLQGVGNSGLTKVNGNAITTAGNVWSIIAEIPISGW